MPALSDNPQASSSDRLTPAERARQAALARLGSSSTPPVSRPEGAHSPLLDQEGAQGSSFNPSRQDVLPFFRILDAQLLPNVSKPQAVKTLETIQTLLGNILSPPNPAAAAKYRQLRLSNSLIKSAIVEPANGAAQDYLVAAGFRTQNVEFQAYLVFAPSPTPAQLHKLRVARHCVTQKLGQAREAEEREARYKESEKAAEAVRKEKALLGYEEDRRLRAEKDEREKIVRAARPPPDDSYQVRSTGPSRWNGGASSSRSTPYPPPLSRAAVAQQQAQAQEADPEAGSDDPPPSYGELHGRVLGTGLPPPGETGGLEERGVRMVSQQDLDEDEEEDDDEEEE
ncbi:hypothetical protein JCM8097_003687 [Rhodosporidiobolus ruineniae]